MFLQVLLIGSLVQISTVQASTNSTTKSTTKPTTMPESQTTPTESPTNATISTLQTTATAAILSAELGANCSTNAWCNNDIGGEAVCDTGRCKCATDYFMLNNTNCLQKAFLDPKNLQVLETEINSTSFNVSWEGDSHISSLNLTLSVTAVSVDTGNMAICPTSRSGGFRATCTALAPGNKFNVTATVAFTDSGGETHKRTKDITQAIDPEKPGPINDTASVLVAPNVNVIWKPASGRVDLYTVKNLGVVTNVTENQITIPDLKAGTAYTIEVSSFSHNRESGETTITFKTESTVPDPPTSVSVWSVYKDNVILRWQMTTQPNGQVLMFQICINNTVYSDLQYTFLRCQNTTDNQTAINVTKLSPGVYYKFAVYTINDKYISDTSGNAFGVTKPSTPGNVLDLTVKPNDTSFIVTWKRPSTPNGNITTYRVDVTTLATNCTVFLKSNITVNKTNDCNYSIEIDGISVNQKSMKFTVSDLIPHTNYTITVTAYTSEGAGSPVSQTKQSSIVKPHPVTDIVPMVLGKNEVNVSWVIPSMNPGPVTYKVKVHDMVTDQQWTNGTVEDKQYIVSKHYNGFTWKNNITLPVGGVIVILAPGYNETSLLIKDLEEFWLYAFSVNACSEAGCSISDISENVTTFEGIPGKPYFNEVTLYNTESNCNATVVTLNWTEPDLRLRNANITRYSVTNIVDSEKKLYNISGPDPYKDPSRTFTLKVESLKAEAQFHWQIYALSADGEKGLPSNIQNFSTAACKPPKWEEDIYGKMSSTSVTTKTITLKFKTDFFRDTSQGVIKDRGLLVATSSTLLTLGNAVPSAKNWNSAQKQQFKIAYRFKPEEISNFGIVTVVVGDEVCSTGSTAADDYCNGRLPQNTRFYVAGYACTSKDCSVSNVYGPFLTSSTPVETEENGAIIALCVVLVLCIVAILIFGFLWFKGIIDPPGWFQPEQGPIEVPVSPIIEIKRKRPILVSNYDAVLEDLHRDTNLLLSDQYEDIGKLSQQIMEKSTTNMSNLEPNKAKNRWVNILPFDHSRVKLLQLDDDEPTSDYINANYMPGFHNKREYIATQGPLPGTIDDFWRMVWEHNVMVIVMLTQCKEGNRVKCEKYWPDEVNEPKQYGEVVVNPISLSQLDKYTITIFTVSQNNQSRRVVHFHYLDFPDFSANVEFDHFIGFVQNVRSHVPHDMVGPIVCHCSAGVGRTGTFIAVDRLNEFLRSPNFSFDTTIDIFEIVMSMRENRVLMVQTESQFVMIHDCFQQMLDAKKESLAVIESEENLYINEAYDPYPEVLYENISTEEMKSELKTEL